MSEYWKSTPKYYCKHCKMYVTDTPLSRKNHDASPKHQGNLKRFLRDIHRNNEREKAAAESAKREVARLNALTGGPSTSASLVSSSSTTAGPPPPKQPTGVLTEGERKRQMKELEDLGVALPDDYRAEMALMGEWKSAEAVPDVPERKMTEKEKVQKDIQQDMKRNFDEEEAKRKWKALDEDEKAIRSFKIETKSYPRMEDEDKGDLERLLKLKGKGKEDVQEEPEVKLEGADPEAGSRIKVERPDLPPGAQVSEGNDGSALEVKKEEGTGVVFKKRKIKNIRKK